MADRLDVEAVRLGQLAYEAYGDERGWAVFNGGRMPTWDEQQPDLRGAWIEAALAVRRAVLSS